MFKLADLIDKFIYSFRKQRAAKTVENRRKSPRFELKDGQGKVNLLNQQSDIKFETSLLDVSESGFKISKIPNKIQIGDIFEGRLNLNSSDYEITCQTVHIGDDFLGFELLDSNKDLDLSKLS